MGRGRNAAKFLLDGLGEIGRIGRAGFAGYRSGVACTPGVKLSYQIVVQNGAK